MTVDELIEVLSDLPGDMPVVVSGRTGSYAHIGVIAKENRIKGWPHRTETRRCETGRCETGADYEYIEVPAHVVLSPPYGPGPYPAIRHGDTPPEVVLKGRWPKPKPPSFEPPLPRGRK